MKNNFFGSKFGSDFRSDFVPISLRFHFFLVTTHNLRAWSQVWKTTFSTKGLIFQFSGIFWASESIFRIFIYGLRYESGSYERLHCRKKLDLTDKIKFLFNRIYLQAIYIQAWKWNLWCERAIRCSWLAQNLWKFWHSFQKNF